MKTRKYINLVGAGPSKGSKSLKASKGGRKTAKPVKSKGPR